MDDQPVRVFDGGGDFHFSGRTGQRPPVADLPAGFP